MTDLAPLTLALIPARGGSKGLPGKNLAMVGEQTLIARAVRSALDSKYVSRVLVSTDSEDIAVEARRCGAQVPFMRPTSLATDTASSVDVALHCLEYVRVTENFLPDWFLLLQPTSPLRTAKDIDDAMALAQGQDCQAVVSVSIPPQHPWLAKTVDPDGYMTNLSPHTATRRQDLPPAYQPNGAIYWVKTEALISERTFYPERTLAHVIPADRAVDIDTAFDLELARFLTR